MRTLLVCSVLLAVTALAGCSEAEQVVRGAAEDAGCAVARQAMDEVERRAQRAVDDIGADPQAAERELRALRDGLAAAEGQLSGEAREQVERAQRALDALLGQARSAAEGTQVDEVAVREAQRELDGSVDRLTTVC